MKKTNVPVVTLAIFMTTFMTAIEGTIDLSADDGCFDSFIRKIGG